MLRRGVWDYVNQNTQDLKLLVFAFTPWPDSGITSLQQIMIAFTWYQISVYNKSERMKLHRIKKNRPQSISSRPLPRLSLIHPITTKDISNTEKSHAPSTRVRSAIFNRWH